jgi:hypothetical protein
MVSLVNIGEALMESVWVEKVLQGTAYTERHLRVRGAAYEGLI